MEKRKSGGKRGEEMMGKEMLRMMVSSDLCESLQNNVHLSHKPHLVY
jgi:hypothetical protein